jgi:hypothetical protein
MRRCHSRMAILAAGLVLIARPFSPTVLAGTIEQTSNPNYNTAFYQLYVDQSLPAATPQSVQQAQGPQLSFTINPTGGVYSPASSADSPLSILTTFPSAVDQGAAKSLGLLPGASAGFEEDSNAVPFDLISTDNTKFGLIFPGMGFESNQNGQGGLLNFSLAVNKSLTSAPTLTPDEPGVHVIGPLPLLPPPSSTTSASTSTSSSGTSTTSTSTSSSGTSSTSTSSSGTSTTSTSTSSTSGASTSLAPTTATTLNTPEPISVVVWSVLGGLGLIRARAMRPRRSAD